MVKNLRSLIAIGLLAGGTLCGGAAYAGSETLSLVKSSLTNVTDAAGTWQYEGGAVQNTKAVNVGTYIISRRVTTAGTSTYNTAAETISLFFAATDPRDAPEVVTIEGSHSFTSGNFKGSVSAASTNYHLLIGSDASATIPVAGTIKLVLNAIGASQRLP